MKKISCLSLLLCILVLVQMLCIPAFATETESIETQPVETVQEGVKRDDCVWTSAGEGEDQVGRATVWDDGAYHYAVTVMAGESQMRELSDIWQDILGSVSLRTD